jgi:hypothetical protein
LPAYNSESVLSRLKQKLERIRTGVEVDLHEWNFVI